MGPPRRSTLDERIEALPSKTEPPKPQALDGLALFDTGVWAWSRDRRFPYLAEWFNSEVRAGHVVVCELVVLELVRVAANEKRAYEIAKRLAMFEEVSMPQSLWRRAREVQLLLAAAGDHRRVPPADLLIAAAAELAGLPVLHYDRDYKRIAAVTGQEQRWFVREGTLA